VDRKIAVLHSDTAFDGFLEALQAIVFREIEVRNLGKSLKLQGIDFRTRAT